MKGFKKSKDITPKDAENEAVEVLEEEAAEAADTTESNEDVSEETENTAHSSAEAENQETAGDDFSRESVDAEEESQEKNEEENEEENKEEDKEEKKEDAKEPEKENKEQETAPKNKKSGKKTAIIISSIIGGLVVAAAAAYFIGVYYYSSHFLRGTAIGDFDCSNMTIEETQEAIKQGIDNYSFTFYEKNDRQETILGSEIYLEASEAHNLDLLLEEQNPYEWIMGFDGDPLPLDIDVSFNPDSLYNRISEMQFMADTRENIKDCSVLIKYEDGAYTIEDDGSRDIVSQNMMFEKVQPKISELYAGMSLEKESCYVGLAEEDTIKGVLNELNRYVSAKITYVNGDETFVLDGSRINEWLNISEDYVVSVDPAQVSAYVFELSKTYDTVGKAHNFTTTSGNEITVSGGDYGWNMNNDAETEELTRIIMNGETVEREPIYKQLASGHGSSKDIGGTYVEISISAQHLWFYKDGDLVVSSDVVTGNPKAGNSTPTGVYSLKYKSKNAVLRGPGYASPVSFWMPFNGGVGLHDAPWRGRFGGSIYNGGGSHGCVNLPYSTAAKLYSNLSTGDPVVVY